MRKSEIRCYGILQSRDSKGARCSKQIDKRELATTLLGFQRFVMDRTISGDDLWVELVNHVHHFLCKNPCQENDSPERVADLWFARVMDSRKKEDAAASAPRRSTDASDPGEHNELHARLVSATDEIDDLVNAVITLQTENDGYNSVMGEDLDVDIHDPKVENTILKANQAFLQKNEKKLASSRASLESTKTVTTRIRVKEAPCATDSKPPNETVKRKVPLASMKADATKLHNYCRMTPTTPKPESKMVERNAAQGFGMQKRDNIPPGPSDEKTVEEHGVCKALTVSQCASGEDSDGRRETQERRR